MRALSVLPSWYIIIEKIIYKLFYKKLTKDIPFNSFAYKKNLGTEVMKMVITSVWNKRKELNLTHIIKTDFESAYGNTDYKEVMNNIRDDYFNGKNKWEISTKHRIIENVLDVYNNNITCFANNWYESKGSNIPQGTTLSPTILNILTTPINRKFLQTLTYSDDNFIFIFDNDFETFIQYEKAVNEKKLSISYKKTIIISDNKESLKINNVEFVTENDCDILGQNFSFKEGFELDKNTLTKHFNKFIYQKNFYNRLDFKTRIKIFKTHILPLILNKLNCYFINNTEEKLLRKLNDIKDIIIKHILGSTNVDEEESLNILKLSNSDIFTLPLLNYLKILEEIKIRNPFNMDTYSEFLQEIKDKVYKVLQIANTSCADILRIYQSDGRNIKELIKTIKKDRKEEKTTWYLENKIEKKDKYNYVFIRAHIFNVNFGKICKNKSFNKALKWLRMIMIINKITQSKEYEKMVIKYIKLDKMNSKKRIENGCLASFIDAQEKCSLDIHAKATERNIKWDDIGKINEDDHLVIDVKKIKEIITNILNNKHKILESSLCSRIINYIVFNDITYKEYGKIKAIKIMPENNEDNKRELCSIIEHNSSPLYIEKIKNYNKKRLEKEKKEEVKEKLKLEKLQEKLKFKGKRC